MVFFEMLSRLPKRENAIDTKNKEYNMKDNEKKGHQRRRGENRLIT